MTEFVLPASMFSGEPVEREVIYNPKEVAAGGEKMSIFFLLVPVTAAMDAEYTSDRGHNDSVFRFRPRKNESQENDVEFEPMERVVHNDREIKAIKRLAKKVIKGWRPFKLSDGTTIAFSEHNLEKLSEFLDYIRPPIEEAYRIAGIKKDVEEGNSETSFGGSATPNEAHDGDRTFEPASMTE